MRKFILVFFCFALLQGTFAYGSSDIFTQQNNDASSLKDQNEQEDFQTFTNAAFAKKFLLSTARIALSTYYASELLNGRPLDVFDTTIAAGIFVTSWYQKLFPADTLGDFLDRETTQPTLWAKFKNKAVYWTDWGACLSSGVAAYGLLADSFNFSLSESIFGYIDPKRFNDSRPHVVLGVDSNASVKEAYDALKSLEKDYLPESCLENKDLPECDVYKKIASAFENFSIQQINDNPYQAFGVSTSVSQKDLNPHYRELALKLHSDRCKSPFYSCNNIFVALGNAKEELDKKFQRIAQKDRFGDLDDDLLNMLTHPSKDDLYVQNTFSFGDDDNTPFSCARLNYHKPYRDVGYSYGNIKWDAINEAVRDIFSKEAAECEIPSSWKQKPLWGQRTPLVKHYENAIDSGKRSFKLWYYRDDQEIVWSDLKKSLIDAFSAREDVKLFENPQ